MREKNGVTALLRESAGVFRDNLSSMFFMVLLSVIPIIGDSLHTCIIQQIKNKEEVSVIKALRKVLEYFWRLFAVGFLFTLSIYGWMFVPIYGWLKVIYYSIYSAMVSNVVILEGVTDTAAMKRCREIIMRNKESRSLSIGFLVGIPLLALIFYGVIDQVLLPVLIEKNNTLLFLLFNFVPVFIFAPVFEVGNSLLYYELIKLEAEDGAASEKVTEILKRE